MKTESEYPIGIRRVVHDISGSPLTGILGFAGLLMAEDRALSPEMVRSFAHTIYDQALRVQQGLAEIGALARQEEESLSLNIKAVKVPPLVETVVGTFPVISKDHDFIVKISPGLPLVRADENKIERVLQNLIANAVKYSPSGGHIKVVAIEEGCFVRLSVQDQGLGISKEEQERIFDPGYRIKSLDRENIQGTGLGLATVRDIVTMHQGRVWVESELAKGSAFHFTLPIFGATINSTT